MAFLRDSESKDLVKRFITSKFDYELNSSKAFEMTSAFWQGRRYFTTLGGIYTPQFD